MDISYISSFWNSEGHTMYDIDKFFYEKISLNFDTLEEAQIFSEECKARRIINSNIFLKNDIKTEAFVCNWNGCDKDIHANMILHGSDDFHVAHGWKSMKASELMIENIIPSKTVLMEFLGGE